LGERASRGRGNHKTKKGERIGRKKGKARERNSIRKGKSFSSDETDFTERKNRRGEVVRRKRAWEYQAPKTYHPFRKRTHTKGITQEEGATVKKEKGSERKGRQPTKKNRFLVLSHGRQRLCCTKKTPGGERGKKKGAGGGSGQNRLQQGTGQEKKKSRLRLTEKAFRIGNEECIARRRRKNAKQGKGKPKS